MRAWKAHVVCLMLASMVLQTLAATPASADHFFGRLWRLEYEKWYHGEPPETMCQDDAVEELAKNIDWLEHHIDKYGSIVAKQPDVWGEARMTKHRDEYERMMFERLNQFGPSINAAIAQSDSSFLSQAFALSAAVDGKSPGTATTSVQVDAKTATSTATSAAATTVSAPETELETKDIVLPKDVSLEPTLFLDQMSRYLQHLHELRRINEGDDTSDSPGYAMNLVRVPVSMLPGKMTREGWGAEITITGTPVLSEDLLPNTFRNLAVNDLVDQLSLPLVKTVERPDLLTRWNQVRSAPQALERAERAFTQWSFFNNNADQQEVTKIVADVLNNPMALLVIQKAMEVYFAGSAGNKFPTITKALEDPTRHERIKTEFQEIAATPEFAADHIAEFVDKIRRFGNTADRNDVALAQRNLVFAVISMGMQDMSGEAKAVRGMLAEGIIRTQERAVQQVLPVVPSPPGVSATDANAARTLRDARAAQIGKTVDLLNEIDGVFDEFAQALQDLPAVPVEFEDAMELGASSTAVAVSGRARRASQPVPPSQVVGVYGLNLLYSAANFFCPAYRGRQVRWSGEPHCSVFQANGNAAAAPPEFRVDLLDVQKWLQAEISEAHEFLSQPNHLQLWYDLANPRSGLAAAIRSNHLRGKPVPVLVKQNPIAPTSFNEGALDETINPGFVSEWQETTAIVTPYVIGTLAQPGQPGPHASVEAYRDYFFEQIHKLHFESQSDPHLEVLENLAWALVVETALLNHRLNEDVRKVATAKECGCIPISDEDLSFFLPEAAAKPESQVSEEFFAATRVFQEYVKCRWPIHVFAIDPREQDQNVADASARRRELQFALALGFVTGEISASSLTNYSRELETQVQTISLNRTAVGFSHGHDTFGWRFYPRVQALDVPGTLGTVWQSIHGTPRDADIRKRQLEPGMRECVAIVLMPSFVPYADFDVRSNWFRLTNAKNAAITMKETVLYSRAITAMRNSQAQCAACAHCYREGEVERLLKRVEQLDRELPLQSMRAQVPYENTLGGFEMFNTGITDLAPQLIGWYGAPGVVVTPPGVDPQYSCGCYKQCEHCQCATCNNCPACTCPTTTAGQPAVRPLAQPPAICEGQGTTVFVVGDHLSVHDTKIIAGGVCIPHVQLVSRQIARVTIPSCVNTVNVDGKDYVAVYAATPYGITNHLHIPVHSRLAPKVETDLQKAVATLQQRVELLGSATPEFSAGTKKLEFDAECASPDTTALEFRSKMPAAIDLTFKTPIPPLNSATITMGIFYFGQFQGKTFPVNLKPITLANGTAYRLDLTAISAEIDRRLEAAVPEITMSSFSKERKVAAKALLFYKTADCCEQRMAGEIPIEITLVCDCCEPPAAGGAASGTPQAAMPGGEPIAPVAEPLPPGLPTAVGPELSPTSTAAGCDCAAAPSDLLVR